MKRIVLALVTVVVLVLAMAALVAQAPAPNATPPPIAPVLTEVDAAKVDKVDRDLREMRQQVTILQLQIALLEAQSRPYLQSLVKAGYTLSRGQDGQWRYVAEPPAAPKPEPPKK